ncbi:MAG TPA: hypothetical protein VFE58_08045 [Tepidisphaeraceae bacterium]|jgi:hypothetical protein|nr:hypothetical protein [Tepidisphaeraceae bacterium]
MTFMARLERVFGRFAIPDLTLYLVCGQAGFTIMGLAHKEFVGRIALVPGMVMEGEWWRVLTFPFFPPTTNPIFALFALYLFFIMGRALEANWGEFRFNLYMLIAYVASIGGAFLAYAAGRGGMATSAYFDGSVFLAFAQFYPEFLIYLFFILPVKIKWLALAAWAYYAYSFVTGDGMERALVAASVLNFLIFFARDIVQMMKSGRKKMGRQLKLKITEAPGGAFHTCAVCGITDKTHPKMDFRYCPGCGGQLAYCTEHLNAHEHRVSPR